MSSVDEVIVEKLDRAGAPGMAFSRLQVLCELSESALRATLAQIKAQGYVFAGRRDVWYSSGAVHEMESAIAAQLATLHAKEPLRTFAALNAVAAVAAQSPDRKECFRLALESLQERGAVVARGNRLRLVGHRPQWAGPYAAARERILEKCRQSGLSVPAPQELAACAGLDENECREVLEALADAGELCCLAPGIYVHPDVFDSCRTAVQEFLARNQKMTIGQCRDLLGASRKYLLPFLEELDRQRITVRDGDHRILRRA